MQLLSLSSLVELISLEAVILAIHMVNNQQVYVSNSQAAKIQQYLLRVLPQL